MEKEELETAVLHSDLADPIKLEIIRCIEAAKGKEIVDWDSIPHVRNKELDSDKLEITYK